MNINQFVKLHREDWKHLENLGSTLHKGSKLILCSNLLSK